MLLLHNINLINMVYILHYALYINNLRPSIGDISSNLILCHISSFIWMLNRFLRSYSILCLAFYRYIRIYRIKLVGFTRNRYKNILGIGFSWMCSIFFAIIFKFAAENSNTIFYCFPGGLDSLNKFIIYFSCFLLVSLAIPTILTFFTCFKMIEKINQTHNIPSTRQVIFIIRYFNR